MVDCSPFGLRIGKAFANLRTPVSVSFGAKMRFELRLFLTAWYAGMSLTGFNHVGNPALGVNR
jgi:hypothetical protein